MIIADMHTHSAFSGDSETPMEEQLDTAIRLALNIIVLLTMKTFIILKFRMKTAAR